MLKMCVVNRAEEKKANPKAVIQALQTFQRSVKKKPGSNKFMLVGKTVHDPDEDLSEGERTASGDSGPTFDDELVDKDVASSAAQAEGADSSQTVCSPFAFDIVVPGVYIMLPVMCMHRSYSFTGKFTIIAHISGACNNEINSW